MEQVIGDKEAVILENDDVIKAKTFWKKNCNLNTESFVDFYFDRKALQNKIFAVLEHNQVVSMLHMSPYSVAVRRNNSAAYREGKRMSMADMVKANASCLFAMMTGEEYRHLGLTDEVMYKALSYQKQQMNAFTYHIPKSLEELELYEQFGFAPVADCNKNIRKKEIITDELIFKCNDSKREEVITGDFTISLLDSSQYVTLAHFVDDVLSRNNGIFVIRNAIYYENLFHELQTGNGGIYIIKVEHRIVGYFTMELIEGEEIYREIVFSDPDIQDMFFDCSSKNEFPVLARIVNLRNMVKYVCSEGKVTVAVSLSDPMLRDNNGIFLWYLDENGSRMVRVEDENRQDVEKTLPGPELSATIGEFTSYLFGYRRLKDGRKFDSIHLLGPAWLTEPD